MSALLVVVVVVGFFSACLLFVLGLCQVAARADEEQRRASLENVRERAQERRANSDLYGRRRR